MEGEIRMITVYYGKKGLGKTKTLIEQANRMAGESKGDVVFIDDSNQLLYTLKHKIRFINVSDFPVKGHVAFAGFICGMIAEDYDIDGIFIDGLTYIVKDKIENLAAFFETLKYLAEKYSTKFFISMNGDSESVPEFLKAYIQ